VHTLFSGFLCWICLKQYNFNFSSSADDIAGFQMIYITDLSDRLLLPFYEVTYWSWEHVHSLICGSLYWMCMTYYNFDSDSSVDNNAHFQMMYDINSMKECYRCGSPAQRVGRFILQNSMLCHSVNK
jgi:hypothetical protein